MSPSTYNHRTAAPRSLACSPCAASCHVVPLPLTTLPQYALTPCPTLVYTARDANQRTFFGAALPFSDAGDAVFAFCSSCFRYRDANTLK